MVDSGGTTETAQSHTWRDLWLLRRWRSRTRGQNLMEFALVVPVLLLVIFGIIDLARLIHAQITVTNAARQGVRFAVTGYQEPDGAGGYIPRATSIISRTKQGLVGLTLVDTPDPNIYGWYAIQLNSRDKVTREPRPGDPGGPTEAVEVYVDYNVTMVTPLLNAIFPKIKVQAIERGVNEEWGAVQSFEHANLPPLPTPLPTFTPYPTYTRTSTPTRTPTRTITPTRTNTPTITPTFTTTSTPTITPTGTNTATPTDTPTITPTFTTTSTPDVTRTKTPGPATNTPTPPAFTPTHTATRTPTGPTRTITRTPTSTRTPTGPTRTSTRTHTRTPTLTRTHTSTTTRTPTTTRTSTRTPTNTPFVPTPVPTGGTNENLFLLLEGRADGSVEYYPACDTVSFRPDDSGATTTLHDQCSQASPASELMRGVYFTQRGLARPSGAPTGSERRGTHYGRLRC